MNIVLLFLPIALILGFVFVCAFIWVTFNGQYDDLETPAHRILLDDEKQEN